MIRRQSASAPTSEPQDADPARIYVLTGGRGGPSGHTQLDLVTLVVAVGRRRQEGQIPAGKPASTRRSLFPEHVAILRLCRRPLSAAELSAHLRLPFSATAVLIDDLLTAGLVRTLAAAASALPDPDLIEEVLRGLQRL